MRLTPQQLDYLTIPTPPTTQPPPDNADAPTCLWDGKKVSHNKGAWLKLKINKFPSGVCRRSELKHIFNTKELWAENIPEISKNRIGLVQEKIIAPGWKIIYFIHKKNHQI